MSRIFLSHSSADNAPALAVASWLEASGWADYFLDIEPARGLAPGERWQEALRKAADRCEAVLFLITPAWRDSRWCLAEFLLAKQLGKTVFGVLVEATPLDSLPIEMTSEWQLCDLVHGAERRTFRVRRDPIVPEADVSFACAGLERLRIGLQKSGLDPTTFPWPPPNDPFRAPYRGLRPLEAEDAALFFGREAATVRGLDALRLLRESGVERLLVILGASGAGKSSFLRAGLLPRVARDDRHFLPLPVIRPESAAISGTTGLLASLGAAFGQRGWPRNRAELRDALRKPGGLADLIDELRTAGTEGDATAPTVLIPIDQAEELFGSQGIEESAELISLLRDLLSTPQSEEAAAIASRQRALALVAIRSDSYERFQKEPTLQQVQQSLFNLPPMASTEFKAVIEGPARRATAAGRKLRVQPALTERLLEDSRGADALPLLALTLERLYVQYGADGDLQLGEYEKLGGVQGSIEQAAEAAFAEPGRIPVIPADPAEREQRLREGFIPWLAYIDPESEERKRRVARWSEIPAPAQPLLERLVDKRLLVKDRRQIEGSGEETVIEVAHEALLRQWPKLASWLDQDAADLKALAAVQRAAGEWTKNARAQTWLVHTGERLEAAEALRCRKDFDRLLGENGQGYLRACRARADAERAEKEAQLRRIAEEQTRVADEQRRRGLAQRRAQRLVAAVALIVALAAIVVAAQARNLVRKTSQLKAAELDAWNDQGLHDRVMRYAVLASSESWSGTAPFSEPELVRAAHASRLLTGLVGHEGSVTAAAFSPDSQRVVTASSDQTARVWDTASGTLRAKLEGHGGPVTAAAFSSDGQRVVTASFDKTARVWDAASGTLRAKLEGHGGPVYAAAFSPDGQRVVTASWDETARVWDAASGTLRAKLEGHGGAVLAAAFSPDGQRVVTASWDETARVWDAASGMSLAKLEGHKHRVLAVAFSPDGRRVVTASDDFTGRVWDAASGALLATLEGHEGTVHAAAFSPDGRRVVTASDDLTGRVWDAANGTPLATLEGHEGGVHAAAFSPDGQRVVTASSDQTARVWDATSGTPLAKLDAGRVTAAAFSPDARRVVTASDDGTARVWDAANRTSLAKLEGHGGPVHAAAFSPEGQRVVTSSDDRTARVWDATSGTPLATLDAERVTAAAFSPDGQRVVTASDDGTARVWDAASGTPLAKLEGHGGPVAAAAFSPDGQRVVTASDDRTARVWDAASGTPLATLEGHEGPVSMVAFSPDGRRVVTASWGGSGWDRTTRVWDAASGMTVAKLGGRGGVVTAAAFSPDGRRVVTASSDQTARVWDAANGRSLATLEGHESPVTAAAFSPDGRRVVTASTDRTARVWDAANGRSLATLEGHEGRVHAAGFSPDGRRVVTASDDRTARVWDAASGTPLATFQGHKGPVFAAAFSPDGRCVVTASDDRTAQIWSTEWLTLSGRALIDTLCQKKLRAAQVLTEADVRSARLFRAPAGTHVCEPIPPLERAWRSLTAAFR